MKDGTEVTYFVDGRRKQKFPNGAILEVGKDKSRIQTNPDGTRIETDSSGKTFQSNPNGTSLEIFPVPSRAALIYILGEWGEWGVYRTTTSTLLSSLSRSLPPTRTAIGPR